MLKKIICTTLLAFAINTFASDPETYGGFEFDTVTPSDRNGISILHKILLDQNWIGIGGKRIILVSTEKLDDDTVMMIHSALKGNELTDGLGSVKQNIRVDCQSKRIRVTYANYYKQTLADGSPFLCSPHGDKEWSENGIGPDTPLFVTIACTILNKR